MRTALALALLLAACGGDPGTSPRADASTPSDAAEGAVDAQALLPWEQAGCEPVPICIEVDGQLTFCPSTHDYVGADPSTRGVEDCTRWMRCPAGEGFGGVSEPCFFCRDWSASPTTVTTPEASPDQPACGVEFCPYPDGGSARECGDAGINGA